MRTSFACLHHGLDVRPILKALESQPNLWNEITARQTTKGSPHADTRTIFLRWAADQTVEAAFGDVESIDYPAYEKLPQVRELIATTCQSAAASKLARVIIVSLKPGGKISPHADEGLYADTYERFHLTLQSDFGNKFMVQLGPQHYETAEMRAGELWWFNHKRTHWVENQSNRPRIHLIMDMVAPNYRTERGH